MSVTDNEERVSESLSVSDYFQNKSLLITGGTGFIGQVVVAKLLRSCPQLRCIYFLAREKKGKNMDERFENLLKLPIFDGIPDEILKKLKPVKSSLPEVGLGIDEDIRKEIQENTNVVIHLAATVRFDLDLVSTIKMNVLPIRELLQLAKECKKLEALCYVSTAYSQDNIPEGQTIEEKIYKPQLDCSQFLKDLNTYENIEKEEEMQLMLGHSNPYTFSKALAEYLISEEGSGIPMVIFRPPLVGATYKDPLEGWSNGLSTLFSQSAMIGAGIFCTLKTKYHKQEIVPVDFVANLIITSTYYVATQKSSKPLVCNCINNSSNTTGFRQLTTQIAAVFRENPFPKTYRTPKFVHTSSSWKYSFYRFRFHTVPATLVDAMAVMKGKKARMRSQYKSTDKAMKRAKFWHAKDLSFETTSHSKILNCLQEKDKETFTFDFESIDWDDHWRKMAIRLKDNERIRRFMKIE